jgi:hypothetical protein
MQGIEGIEYHEALNLQSNSKRSWADFQISLSLKSTGLNDVFDRSDGAKERRTQENDIEKLYQCLHKVEGHCHSNEIKEFQEQTSFPTPPQKSINLSTGSPASPIFHFEAVRVGGEGVLLSQWRWGWVIVTSSPCLTRGESDEPGLRHRRRRLQ